MTWAASKIGPGGTHNHDRNTDGELGPERFTEQQKAEFRKQIDAALATQPKEGFANDVEAMEWFRESVFPIANQGDAARMDFEISSNLAPLNSLNGRYKFLNASTGFYNWIVSNGNVHTHQTSNFFSSQDQSINSRSSINRYLVNDTDMYRFRGQDYWKNVTAWKGSGKVGSAPSHKNYYQIYSKGNGWVDL